MTTQQIHNDLYTPSAWLQIQRDTNNRIKQIQNNTQMGRSWLRTPLGYQRGAGDDAEVEALSSPMSPAPMRRYADAAEPVPWPHVNLCGSEGAQIRSFAWGARATTPLIFRPCPAGQGARVGVDYASHSRGLIPRMSARTPLPDAMARSASCPGEAGQWRTHHHAPLRRRIPAREIFDRNKCDIHPWLGP